MRPTNAPSKELRDKLQREQVAGHAAVRKIVAARVPVLKIGDGTMKKNDGDPAVHRHQEGLRDPEISNGMSLRDWFAGQAMIVMLRVPVPCGIPERIAQAAYGIAEAMLAERENG